MPENWALVVALHPGISHKRRPVCRFQLRFCIQSVGKRRFGADLEAFKRSHFEQKIAIGLYTCGIISRHLNPASGSLPCSTENLFPIGWKIAASAKIRKFPKEATRAKIRKGFAPLWYYFFPPHTSAGQSAVVNCASASYRLKKRRVGEYLEVFERIHFWTKSVQGIHTLRYYCLPPHTSAAQSAVFNCESVSYRLEKRRFGEYLEVFKRSHFVQKLQWVWAVAVLPIVWENADVDRIRTCSKRSHFDHKLQDIAAIGPAMNYLPRALGLMLIGLFPSVMGIANYPPQAHDLVSIGLSIN